jgi:hypothetical protein
MVDRVAPSGPQRRRFLSRVALAGLSLAAVGCDRKFPIVPTPLATTPSRRAEPARLEPARTPTSPAVAIGAVFGRVLGLEGVTIDRETVQAGEYLRIWLHWQSIASATEDLRSIGRLVAPNGRVVASEDDQIGGRRYHLTRWSVGERRVDEMRLRVAPNAGAGDYGLMIGTLRPDNLTTVPVTGRASATAFVQEDAILVGTIEVLAG